MNLQDVKSWIQGRIEKLEEIRRAHQRSSRYTNHERTAVYTELETLNRVLAMLNKVDENGCVGGGGSVRFRTMNGLR